jgi:Protein of unknown function (DUF3570)
MQLDPPGRSPTIRGALRAAACVLLATGLPGPAHADGGTTQLDASVLLYGEQGRAKVTEPTVRVTRLFPDGQSFSGQVGIDVITGASPSGALPSGVATPPSGEDGVQTVTAASGGVGSSASDPGQIPTTSFRDTRVALDADWQKPFGLITPVLGGHFSRERDYQSIGGNSKFSLSLLHHLTTLTAGAGFNRDDVFPTGGTRLPLSDSTVIIGTGWNAKRVNGGMVGISQILTRRWLLGVNGSLSVEDGYLTEPYKVVSLMDPSSGITVGQITENRPSRRDRRDILTSSVYHLTRDVLYLSHRYYWDNWGVHSNTLDLKYRGELGDSAYLQPHLRYYSQSPADFFKFGLIQGVALPAFVSSDERLGPLRTATLGATVGFTTPGTRGEWTIRAEYIRQFGKGHPNNVVGVQRDFDLFPAVNIGSLVVAYSVSL